MRRKEIQNKLYAFDRYFWRVWNRGKIYLDNPRQQIGVQSLQSRFGQRVGGRSTVLTYQFLRPMNRPCERRDFVSVLAGEGSCRHQSVYLLPCQSGRVAL